MGGGKADEISYSFFLQPGLIRHLKHHSVAIRQGRQADADGLALPPLRIWVVQGGKAVFFRQRRHLGILSYHHHAMELIPGNGGQCVVYQRFSASQIHCQLILAEAAAKARRH